MNNSEKNEMLHWLGEMQERFGQEIAVERKNGARLRFDEIIDGIIETIKDIPAAEDCHTCKDCKWFEREKRLDGGRICTKLDVLIFDDNEIQCLYGENRIANDYVAEQCPECGNTVATGTARRGANNDKI